MLQQCINSNGFGALQTPVGIAEHVECVWIDGEFDEGVECCAVAAAEEVGEELAFFE